MIFDLMQEQGGDDRTWLSMLLENNVLEAINVNEAGLIRSSLPALAQTYVWTLPRDSVLGLFRGISRMI